MDVACPRVSAATLAKTLAAANEAEALAAAKPASVGLHSFRQQQKNMDV
jgi:hypothetical protein